MGADDLEPKPKPPEEKPPLQKSHSSEGKKTSTKKPKMERQSRRPRCPRCKQLMTAVQTRPLVTDYQCAHEECPERARIKVARKEMFTVDGKINHHRKQHIKQRNVSARVDMDGPG